MLHAIHIGFFIDPQRRKPRELLRDWWSLVDIAEAVSKTGSTVSVIQACAYTETITQDNVTYYFVAAESAAPSFAESNACGKLIRELAADVFHVHGLGFPDEVCGLARVAPGVPILLQDHADRPPRFWRRRSWRRGLSMVAGITFCAREQSEPFRKARLLHSGIEIFEIPESTSRFTPGDQIEARRVTGLNGNPCLLWVGHLNKNKDPLSVLDGVSKALQQFPDLELWCCFGRAPLLAAVERRLRQEPQLSQKVHLLGKVEHAKVEQLMRSADIFVLGSHREGSGYSVIEALACGLPPLVTNIPSFRALTSRGAVGRLWSRGNSQQLAQAIYAIASQPHTTQRTIIRAHFEEELSFAALGHKLISTYASLIARKRDMQVTDN